MHDRDALYSREKPTFSFCFPSDGEVMPITRLFWCLAQSKVRLVGTHYYCCYS